VTDVSIGETAKVLEGVRDYDDAMVNPPGLKWPRLRCFLSFKDEDPTQPDYVRVLGWCVPGLRELCFDVDKVFSRMAAMMAIPELLKVPVQSRVEDFG